MNIIYLIRHGEVEHHRADVQLTARGRDQARSAGATLAGRLNDGDAVVVLHSPVTRVRETAELLHASLAQSLAPNGLAERVALVRPRPDEALSNVRFILGAGCEPQEPSLVYEQTSSAAALRQLPPARAGFYRGFWASSDPMGYWLRHDSGGGAESPQIVVGRLVKRLRAIVDRVESDGPCTHWLMVTHSGAMRAFLARALGADPGEPGFCEMITLQPAAGRVAITYRGRTAGIELH